MMLFEVYMYEDQIEKRGVGQHIRFVSAANPDEAYHKVSYVWGHWWRMCGMREVSEAYWQQVHDQLTPGSEPHKHSIKAHSEFGNNE